MFCRSAIVAATLLLSSPALTQEDWVQRRNAARQCELMRDKLHTAVSQWAGKLWFASTDNSPDGYLNPNVVIAARQQVQNIINESDWRMRDITSRPGFSEHECAALVETYANRIGTYIGRVLQQGTAWPR